MGYRTAVLVSALFLLAACGKSDEQPAPKLFQDQREALDKAKAVDAAAKKLEEEQRKAIEQQSQ
ncbi:MAG: hypothetical protein HZB47_04460 [Nitrosomonadales bacterium]|nr:hypothetical protein [Nitrosomonadales bacterium]